MAKPRLRSEPQSDKPKQKRKSGDKYTEQAEEARKRRAALDAKWEQAKEKRTWQDTGPAIPPEVIEAKKKST